MLNSRTLTWPHRALFLVESQGRLQVDDLFAQRLDRLADHLTGDVLAQQLVKLGDDLLLLVFFHGCC